MWSIAKRDRLVIFASTLGTVFEWYDFFIYGTLARGHRPAILPDRQRDRAVPARAGLVRRRLRGAADRRDPVRHPRRQARPQIHLPRHHHPDGLRHRRGRAGAELCRDRHGGADHPRQLAHACRGWRWAANMAAPRSTSPSMRRATSAASTPASSRPGVIGGFLLSVAVVLISEWFVDREAWEAWGWRIPVPGLGAAARGLALGAAEAQGEPGLPGDEGGRQDRAQPAHARASAAGSGPR